MLHKHYREKVSHCLIISAGSWSSMKKLTSLVLCIMYKWTQKWPIKHSLIFVVILILMHQFSRNTEHICGWALLLLFLSPLDKDTSLLMSAKCHLVSVKIKWAYVMYFQTQFKFTGYIMCRLPLSWRWIITCPVSSVVLSVERLSSCSGSFMTA